MRYITSLCESICTQPSGGHLQSCPTSPDTLSRHAETQFLCITSLSHLEHPLKLLQAEECLGHWVRLEVKEERRGDHHLPDLANLRRWHLYTNTKSKAHSCFVRQADMRRQSFAASFVCSIAATLLSSARGTSLVHPLQEREV